MATTAYDAALQNRQYDKDGRLHILRTRISKATVNPYYGREIPNSETLGLDPNRVYYLLRDPKELKKAADSFARVPLMFTHIITRADDPHQDQIAGTIGSDVEYEDPYLIADLSVWDAEAIAGIETDTVRELSSSYRYTADMTPGVFDGTPYDGVMRNIFGNHVALVEKGRAGRDVMAADREMEKQMKETKFGKLIYAILCAASPKLAKDAALKPLVVGLTPQTLDGAALEPKLLAMDAELPAVAIKGAMDAAKDAAELDDKQEDDEQEKSAKDCKKAKDKKAKDKKAKDEDDKDEEDSQEDDEDDDKEADNDPDPKAKDKKAKDKKAMDAELKVAMDEFKTQLRDAENARRDVRPIVGEVIAQDSAAEIYGFALDHMKIDREGVEGVPALRALFNLAVTASKEKAPSRPAFDSAGDMATKFPNASRVLRMM